MLLVLVCWQTRDAILKGAHPVNQDEAVQFAGLQCQIQFGDHVETKHKPGFLELVSTEPSYALNLEMLSGLHCIACLNTAEIHCDALSWSVKLSV